MLHFLASLTGFLSAIFFALSMCLALRLVTLDRLFGGLGRLYRWHHRAGMMALVLMLLHPLLVGAAALQVRPESALNLLWPNPSSLIVFTGWVSLLGFLAFFVATVSPEIPYRIWRQIHRASVLAYLMMGAHIVAVGSGSVAASLTLVMLGLGLLAFGFRVMHQDIARGGFNYRVVAVEKRDEDVLDLVLEPMADPMRYGVGQFAYLAISDSEDSGGCGELHPYTMTSVPGEKNLNFSIKALGPCTRHLQAVRPGATAMIKGPYGALFPIEVNESAQVWIGGGVGITPFLAAMKDKATAGPVDLFYAAKSMKAARFLSDLMELGAGRPEVRIHTICEDTDGRPSAEAILSLVGGTEGRHFIIAGPTGMVESLTAGLRTHGVPSSRIHSELGVLR